jgi:hypothetical protein
MLLTVPAVQPSNIVPMIPDRVTEEHQHMKDMQAVDAELYAYESEPSHAIKTYLNGGSNMLLVYWVVR